MTEFESFSLDDPLEDIEEEENGSMNERDSKLSMPYYDRLDRNSRMDRSDKVTHRDHGDRHRGAASGTIKPSSKAGITGMWWKRFLVLAAIMGVVYFLYRHGLSSSSLPEEKKKQQEESQGSRTSPHKKKKRKEEDKKGDSSSDDSVSSDEEKDTGSDRVVPSRSITSREKVERKRDHRPIQTRKAKQDHPTEKEEEEEEEVEKKKKTEEENSGATEESPAHFYRSRGILRVYDTLTSTSISVNGRQAIPGEACLRGQNGQTHLYIDCFGVIRSLSPDRLSSYPEFPLTVLTEQHSSRTPGFYQFIVLPPARIAVLNPLKQIIWQFEAPRITSSEEGASSLHTEGKLPPSGASQGPGTSVRESTATTSASSSSSSSSPTEGERKDTEKVDKSTEKEEGHSSEIFLFLNSDNQLVLQSSHRLYKWNMLPASSLK